MTEKNGDPLTLRQALECARETAEVTQTAEQGIVVTPKNLTPINIIRLSELLEPYLARWRPTYNVFVISKENADLNSLGYEREYRLVPRQRQQAAQDDPRAYAVSDGEKENSHTETEAAGASQAETDPRAKAGEALGRLRAHFSPPKLSQDEITQALRTLVSSGLSANEIAAGVGLSRAQVYRLLKQSKMTSCEIG